MNNITRHGEILKIGDSFVDAVSGTLKSQGTVTVRKHACAEKTLTWVSTYDCVRSERVLRKAVADEGHTVTCLSSQAT